jgi:integrase
MPAFMAELRQLDSINARALEFTILTAARTAEAVGAKWEEIDFETGVWTVPAERMKPGKPHVVPLSERALLILAALPRMKGDFVFPGSKPETSIHKTMMLQLLRTMRDGLTVHGFRSSFSDWCGERTDFDHETREFALSHVIPDKAKAAYRRYRSLEKRRKLMEAWSTYCASTPPEGKVIALHDAA